MVKPFPLVWSIPLTDIPAGGMTIARELSAPERAALAEFAGIEDVGALTAEAGLAWKAGEVRLALSFAADVVQACVVSLEPVKAHLEESLVRSFIPAPDAARREAAEIDLDPGEADPPDVLSGPSLDLAGVLVEHFILALDPYPRARGAAPPAYEEEQGEAEISPFSVLKRLKDAD